MATEAVEVVKILKSARQDPVGFAFGIAASGNMLIVEKNKTGEQMLAVLKKTPGLKQSCFGMVSYDGAALNIACEKPISNFPKLAEAWGKAQKFAFKVVLNEAENGAEKEATADKHAAEHGTAEESEEDEEDELAGTLFSFEQVKRRLAQAKVKPMHFAFGAGSGDKPDLLAVHPLKDGEKLLRMVRAENGAIKRAYGTVTVEGAMVTFTCAEDPFSGMKRFVRRLFKGWKLPVRVTIIGPSGELDEPDEDEIGEVTAEAVTNLLPDLKAAIAGMSAEEAAQVKSAYAECLAAVKVGDAEKAATLFAMLKQSGDAVTTQLAEKVTGLRDALATLLPRLKEIAAKGGQREQIQQLWRDAETALTASNLVQAETVVEALRRIADADTKAVDQPKLQSIWQDALDDLSPGLNALQAELRRSKEPVLNLVGEKGLAVATGRLQTGLRVALIEFDKASSVGLEKARDLVARRVVEFGKFLSNDALVTLIDDNPFGIAVNIKRTLSQALREIEARLAQSSVGEEGARS